MHVTIPRFVLGAPHGRSGKTTITLGLIAALVKRGFIVQPFKKGPDYIDPSWLTLASGRPCRNLDLYFMAPHQLRNSFLLGCQGADLAIVEGAMGLFDGLDLEGTGSTAEIALSLEAPVVLVLDATRMTRSAAALVQGFKNFDPRVRLAGILLNRVARPRHEEMLRCAIEKYTGIPVVGAIPKDDRYLIPDRHLGLVPATENERLHVALETARGAVEAGVNLDLLLDIARTAPPIVCGKIHRKIATVAKVRLGVFRDRAFHFYYPENLEALARAGAELVFIDSFKEAALPPVDGLYIGGGFPEVFAGALEENFSLRRDIRRVAREGMPIYAECGGLMYLARRIKYGERWYEMVGALPLDVQMENKPQGHGYTFLKACSGNPFFNEEAGVKGHEFHHSRVINLDKEAVHFAYRVVRGWGIDGKFDGLLYRNILAGYTHLFAPAHPEWAERLVAWVAGSQKGEHNVGRG
ncbi:MAG: hydrogenobyrinic acid a,c-diamide synthase (glutamine-hydrolyzing) [Thermanaeromonas sp.]|uniref:cobyrinate a,c-diamide synthase n=1 Tax=Thermanaeromonas sp. TaxID=2003697 RepID=UPI0024383B82|nr:cobyrinate a,c-diamide synthase [Thermanaeromonas sp.]MCG0277713.1 hydrogenobyrinic acid a,c-diamide synthase (glutamine-hydrolyzing) [Thermanaeromonas sp.]